MLPLITILCYSIFIVEKPASNQVKQFITSGMKSVSLLETYVSEKSLT